MTGMDSDTSQDIAEAISLKGGRYLEAQIQVVQEISRIKGVKKEYNCCREARLTVIKEAAIARNKDNKSTVLRLRLATLQQFYSFFLFIMMIFGQPESGPPGIALP